MFAALNRIWSALRSVFRRKKYATVPIRERSVPDCTDQTEHEDGSDIDEECKKEKPMKQEYDVQSDFMRRNFARYDSAMRKQLKKANKVKALAQYHGRKRIRKKNLARLGREVRKMVPLYRFRKHYFFLTLPLPDVNDT